MKLSGDLNNQEVFLLSLYIIAQIPQALMCFLNPDDLLVEALHTFCSLILSLMTNLKRKHWPGEEHYCWPPFLVTPVWVCLGIDQRCNAAGQSSSFSLDNFWNEWLAWRFQETHEVDVFVLQSNPGGVIFKIVFFLQHWAESSTYPAKGVKE